jgi:hypothetical protein
MKKIFTVLAVVLFTISASAQTAKTTTKSAKKESCCAKTMSADEVAKCQAKCKAEGKVCTAKEAAKCDAKTKKCCAKKA